MRFGQAHLTALQAFAARFRTRGAHVRIEECLKSLGGLKKPSCSGASSSVLTKRWFDARLLRKFEQQSGEIVIPTHGRSPLVEGLLV